MNPALSIAIPTYNRAAVLLENLRDLLPDLVETGVAVHVSDDSTDDLTQSGIVELQRAYPGIHYHRNQPGLGHDRNCLKTLSLPITEYVWYLGDSQRILPGGLKRILGALAETPCDFAVVNSADRGPIDLPAGLYCDAALILERLSWHMTLTGSTIYARGQLEDLEGRFGGYPGTNFIQLGIVLESLPTSRRGLLWTGEKWLAQNRGKVSSYWVRRVFEVFARDWARFILALPDTYSMESKRKAIREHSLQTGLLEWEMLARFRHDRILDIGEVKRHWRFLQLASGVPVPAIALLSVMPRPFAKLLSRLAPRRKRR